LPKCLTLYRNLKVPMEEENYYKNLQQAFDELPENFTILEEQVNVSVQMSYYSFSTRIKRNGIPEDFRKFYEELFKEDLPVKERKKMLVTLASVDEVTAFRTIEKYLLNPDPGLKAWAILALQESRMRLQSSLLEEQQVFISTGLGGKGQKLRYFIVFINALVNSHLSETQKKLLESEVRFLIGQKGGEVEEFEFMEGYTTCLAVLPLKADLGTIFRKIIEECNQYGNFLHEDLLITNVKRLRKREIIKMLNDRQPQET